MSDHVGDQNPTFVQSLQEIVDDLAQVSDYKLALLLETCLSQIPYSISLKIGNDHEEAVIRFDKLCEEVCRRLGREWSEASKYLIYDRISIDHSDDEDDEDDDDDGDDDDE